MVPNEISGTMGAPELLVVMWAFFFVVRRSRVSVEGQGAVFSLAREAPGEFAEAQTAAGSTKLARCKILKFCVFRCDIFVAIVKTVVFPPMPCQQCCR